MNTRTLVTALLLVGVFQPACSKEQTEADATRDRSDSLAGVDTDGNGVRDDLDEYIQSAAAGSALTQKAMEQNVQALEELMLAHEIADKSIDSAIKVMRATECLYGVNPTEAAHLSDEIEARMFNTPERAKAYASAHKHLGGQYFRGTRTNERVTACDFDVGALEK